MNWIKKQIKVFLFWFGIGLFIHAWFDFDSIFIYQKMILGVLSILTSIQIEKNL